MTVYIVTTSYHYENEDIEDVFDNSDSAFEKVAQLMGLDKFRATIPKETDDRNWWTPKGGSVTYYVYLKELRK